MENCVTYESDDEPTFWMVKGISSANINKMVVSTELMQEHVK